MSQSLELYHIVFSLLQNEHVIFALEMLRLVVSYKGLSFSYVQETEKNLIIDGYFFQEREIIFD